MLGNDYRHPAALTSGFHTALLIAAGLTAAGGVIAWVGLGGGVRQVLAPAAAESHCAVDGPPLRPRPAVSSGTSG